MNLSALVQSLSNDMSASLLGKDLVVESLCTDTRTISKGEMFVALKGENFDGHDYLDLAIEKGAIAAMVEEQDKLLEKFKETTDSGSLSLLVVEDTTRAFGLSAAFHAQSCPARRIALTGSCGKTTVKEMIASMLRQKGEVLATQGNFNNEIGVPKTLLSINEAHDYAVIEMGANHFGEIGYLSGLSKAEVVLITNADRAHLEGFGSVDGVSKAKGEIFSGAAENAVAILNIDDRFFTYWKGLVEEHGLQLIKVSASGHQDADISLKKLDQHKEGFDMTVAIGPQELNCTLNMLGEHNVLNSLMAIAVVSVFNLSFEEIKTGLVLANPPKGRLNVVPVNDYLDLIDDTYNANPLSVKAAIDVLDQSEARNTILVMGDMAELGSDEVFLHKELGNYLNGKNIALLVTVGELSQHIFEEYKGEGQQFEDHKSASDYLLQKINPDLENLILVKGSRSAGMETVVVNILDHCGKSEAAL